MTIPDKDRWNDDGGLIADQAPAPDTDSHSLSQGDISMSTTTTVDTDKTQVERYADDDRYAGAAGPSPDAPTNTIHTVKDRFSTHWVAWADDFPGEAHGRNSIEAVRELLIAMENRV